MNPSPLVTVIQSEPVCVRRRQPYSSLTTSIHLSLFPCVQRANLFLSDIPPHDMARDFVLLAEQLKVESDLKEKLEVRTIAWAGL